MCVNKLIGSLLIAALSYGTATATVIESIKANACDTKKFTVKPKIVEINGEKSLCG